MGFDSIATFVEAVSGSGLLQPAQVNELTTSLRFGYSDPVALAWRVVGLGWLTTYQINQIARGKAAELILGDYVVLGSLGQGSMSQVFKARRRDDDRLAAVKVIRPELHANEEAMRQFRWEVEVLAEMTHPNVVRTLGAGEAGGRCFLAMEFIEGAPLRTLIKRAGPLPVAHACTYVGQAALGLQYADELGLVHRDLKPANLFLALAPGLLEHVAMEGWNAIPEPSGARVKILDWGLSSRLTPTGVAQSCAARPVADPLGTTDYVSPELGLGLGPVDVRSDLYSLGCTFYYLLTGVPPFPGGSIMQRLLKHQQAEPPPLRAHRHDVPAAVELVLHVLMSKRPEDRYQAPIEVAKALLAALDKPAKSGTASVPATAGPARADGHALRPEERRTSIRHDCKLDVSCRALSSGDDVSWPIRVIDISRTGLAVEVERRFEPRVLLEVCLAPDRTILAQVTNVRKQGAGQWIIGCSFATALGDDEIWALRSEQVTTAAAACRAWYRLQPLEQDDTHRPAGVVNVSSGGVALVVPERIDAGTPTWLALQGDPRLPPLLMAAQVARATVQADGDWLIDCTFLGELREEEVRELSRGEG